MVVGYGNREFVKLMFKSPSTGALKFYVNEMINGQPEMIEDDNLFEDISMFMDLAAERYKHGRG